MKYSILFITLFYNTVFSQPPLNYLGTLILNNNKVISFKLELTENKGIVKGFSITNIGTKDETKSEIKGLYFKSDKSFQLQETQIVSTNSDAPSNTFCYINMQLYFKGILGKKRLEGSFTGNFHDGSECAKGKIIMIEEKKINKKLQKLKKKITRKNKNISQNDINPIKKTIILKDGDDFTIKWESNKLILSLWDDNKEDGDKIQVKINNSIILDKFETKNNRKKIKSKLKNGENIIEIRAVNIGISPPNTSRIELVDNKKIYQIKTELKLKKSAIIKIIK
ncbi:MAG: hypothetical protein CMD14_07170 [Flavobacteriales bacterium]|mgnify:FL=1|nr:hypothetical protein [Flavobacteriales bacterium]|tara:strand:- start:22425 stop:23267 length:843 start_codon:yes stop_codon:yes gene_type:complete